VDNTKMFYESKVFWVNVAAAALEITQMLSAANVLPSGTVTLAIAAANILLRRVTSTPMRFLP
jgi:hypothetical protein